MKPASRVGPRLLVEKLSVGALLGVAIVLLFAQTAGRAEHEGPLPYTRGYLVTGNYVVGGVDLTEDLHPIDLDGFSTAPIPMSGVPANADIMAAYLFWETITLQADEGSAGGVKFRGQPVDITDEGAVKKTSEGFVGAVCWSSGQPLVRHMFRADVLRFLPKQVDKNDRPTGKRLVNDADLSANGFGLNTVTLPVRSGNAVPESAGASLVVVYNDPTQTTLRKVVLYDGIYVQPDLNVPMVQKLQGFYKSATTPSAQITHITASGQPNNNDQILFNSQVIASNPFLAGSASQRSWASATYPLTTSNMQESTNDPDYGETATTTVRHQPANGGEDCLAWGAVVFSTAVADVDNDGLPDGLEDAPVPLKDPNHQELPNLYGMGARSTHQDLVIEVNAMRAAPGTEYGSGQSKQTDQIGHHHWPTPDDLMMIGDRFAAHGISVHFDVGNIDDYHALGVIQHADWIDDYTVPAGLNDKYLVPTAYARGGEEVKERACVPSQTTTCQFPDYPGTVGWKYGFSRIRNAPVDDDGGELTIAQLTDPNEPGYFNWALGEGRRRFDRVRYGLVHYLLYAHALGRPKSLPCLVYGLPARYNANNGTACIQGPNYGNNPLFTVPADYNVPASTSGIADLPGGSLMVTLGRWDEFVGRPFVRAATTFHELGHNLNLWHGGWPAIWGSKPQNTETYIEPNCKPNYPSSMSYLFQKHGLFDVNDEINIDYSDDAQTNLNENSPLSDGALAPASPYRPAWFAPALSTLATSLGVPAATRFCSGAQFPQTAPAAMARVYTTTPFANIDWNGDTVGNGSLASQNVNFDGTQTAASILTTSLKGFDDWAAIRLNQIGAGRNMMLLSNGDNDVGDNDVGDNDVGDNDVGDNDVGDNDVGDNDVGDNDVGDNDVGAVEQDLETAKGQGRIPPYALKACVQGVNCTVPQVPPAPGTALYHKIQLRWQPPTFDKVVEYDVEFKRGDATSTFPWMSAGPSTTGASFAFGQLPNGIQFTSRTRADFTNPTATSGWSRITAASTETAINEAPVAKNDVYSNVPGNKPFNRSAEQGVFANNGFGEDTDVDTPKSFWVAVQVGVCSNGTLTLNANGSFTYKPTGGVTQATCQYKVNNGVWSVDPSIPLSVDSEIATITFNLIKK